MRRFTTLSALALALALTGCSDATDPAAPAADVAADVAGDDVPGDDLPTDAADIEAPPDAGPEEVAAPTPLAAEYPLADEEAYPEAVTFDPQQRAFFTGSLARGNVLRIDADGSEQVHFEGNDDGQHWLVLGVEADAARGRLWACAALTPQLVSSEIWLLDLETGARTWQKSLEGVHPGAACTDMIVAADGTAYVTDRESPNVYHLDPEADTATLLTTDPALGGGIGLNGAALTPDGEYLLVILFAPGTLLRIDLADPTQIQEIPLNGVEQTFGLDAVAVLDGRIYLVRDDAIIQATPNADWTASEAVALPLPAGGYSGLTTAEGALYASRSDVTRYALGLPPNLPFALTRIEPDAF